MKRQAFTLIELAVVLTIVGLVIGGSFKALKYSREKAYVEEAKERVNASKDAIVGYAMSWIDLPTQNEFATTLSPLSGNIADQNRTFFYHVDSQLANDVDICSFNTTNLDIDVYNNAGAIDHTINDVAFVVADQSANRNIQTFFSTSGTQDTVNVYANTATEDDNSRDFTRTIDEYDDVVSWVTLSELQKLVECSKNGLEILNDSELIGNTTIMFNGEIYATKGSPYSDGADLDNQDDYEWCIEAMNDVNYSCGIIPNISIVKPPAVCDSSSFSRCTYIEILDGNYSSGNHLLKIYVKDQSDNNISKDLLLKIIP